jgi:hypothetical protein
MNSIAYQSDGMTEITAQELGGDQHYGCQQRCGEESAGRIFAWVAIACVVHVHENHFTAEAQQGGADVSFWHTQRLDSVWICMGLQPSRS